MYGFISGLTDTNDINYCPKCGKEIGDYYGDGTALCNDCGYRFGVVEVDDKDDE